MEVAASSLSSTAPQNLGADPDALDATHAFGQQDQGAPAQQEGAAGNGGGNSAATSASALKERLPPPFPNIALALQAKPQAGNSGSSGAQTAPSSPPAHPANNTATDVDAMGQPLHGPSNYNAFKQFGKIWSGGDALLTKLGKTAQWATYTVPDAEQKAAAMNARNADSRFAQLDQIEGSPLGAIAYGMAHLFGASLRTQQAVLNLGTAAEGLGMAAVGVTGGRVPAFMGARVPEVAPPEETAVRPGAGEGANSAAQQTVAENAAKPVNSIDGQAATQAKGVGTAANSGTVVNSTGEIAGSIRNVNPGYPKAGRTQNCVNCAVATNATLSGTPASALPSAGPLPRNVLERQYGSRFGPTTTVDSIEQELSAAGNGSRGIVFGSRGPGEVGHVFNVVNQNGTIRFLDGQTGKAASLDGYMGFNLLRTN